MASSDNYYDILGVSHNSTLDEIKRAYRRQALKHHPHRNRESGRDTERSFRDISEAYYVLSDPELRRKYDKRLRKHPGTFRRLPDYSIDSARNLFNRFFGRGDPYLSYYGPEDDFFRTHRYSEDFLDEMGRDPYEIFRTYKIPEGADVSRYSKEVRTHTEILPDRSGSSTKTIIEDKGGEKVKRVITTIMRPDGTQETHEDVQVFSASSQPQSLTH